MNSANAGYAVTGSGGGGADGDYMFASIEEVDSLVNEWLALRDRIFERGHNLKRAKSLIAPPAEDPMSREHAKLLILSMAKAQVHNDAMHAYASGYVSKLTASRDQYVANDDDAAVQLRNVDES